MAGSYQQFSAELDAEMEAFEGKIRETKAEIALEGYSGVVEKTPIDTGFARNNWFAEVGDGATRETNGGSGGPSAAEAVVQSDTYDAITIANGAEYIGVLESGRSQQAPNGMVEVTLAELQTKFRRVK